MDEKKFYKQILTEVIRPILIDYAQQRRLSELAIKLGVDHRSRLSELKNGNRDLTFFWLNIFVKGGIMGIDQILRGRELSELNDVELDTVLRLDPDKEILVLFYKAKRQGVDVKGLLRSVVKD